MSASGKAFLASFSPVAPSSTAILVPLALQSSVDLNLPSALVKTVLPVYM
jgi:hypothetical protein